MNIRKISLHLSGKTPPYEKFSRLEFFEIQQAEDEQIDLVIKNNIDKPFWLNFKSPVIILKAKNWSKPTPVKELDILLTKLWNHNNFSRIWFFVAMKWFTEPTEELLKRQWTTEKILVKITWNDINELLTDKLDPLEWLEWLVIKSFV